MNQLIASKQQQQNHHEDPAVDELVNRFLKLSDPITEDGFPREEPFNGTKVKIEDNGGKLAIGYEFTEVEVAILQTLSQVTGVSLNWLAKDALNWTRGYIAGLPEVVTGQLSDLIDPEEGSCPVPASHRNRASAFLRTVKSQREGQRRAAAKRSLLA